MNAVLDLLPLILGCYLGWTGMDKLVDRSLRARVSVTALPRLTRGVRGAVWVLRSVGIAELALAVMLLWWPTAFLPAVGAALLGLVFVGYLGYSRAIAPESSCGCTANAHAPVSAVDFARAGVLVLGGTAATMAITPWWTTISANPAMAFVTVVLAAALLIALSVDLPRWRQRLFRHPLAGTSGLARTQRAVPVAATLDLLDRSAAWSSAAPMVRSGLLEHWDTDGWRILRFAGVRDDRPVSVLFAVDATATLANTPEPRIRLGIVDEERTPERSLVS